MREEVVRVLDDELEALQDRRSVHLNTIDKLQGYVRGIDEEIKELTEHIAQLEHAMGL